jgi:glycosyltransferase involved in cell wall biosynthesis
MGHRLRGWEGNGKCETISLVTECRATIVVPCYNEAHRLRTEPFFEFLAGNTSVRFLFVNDGSTDNTLSLLEALVRDAIRLGHQGRIAVLDKKVNGGKAEAIRDGMNAAMTTTGTTTGATTGTGTAAGTGASACEYVGFWDADLATPLSAIPQLLGVLEGAPHLEMIFGARVRLLGRTIRRNPARHYLGRLFATVASRTLKLAIYDTQCGAKVFKAGADLRQVLGEPFLSRWIFDVEMIARYIRLRGRHFCFHSIYEFPLESWHDVAGSKVGPFDFFHAGFDILRIYRRYLRKL